MSSAASEAWKYIHCFFCGGKTCKYEDYTRVRSSSNPRIALEGLHSNWVTRYVVASQRPSTRLIRTFHIIKQMKEKNIHAIFNLEEAGEHPLCGDGIHEESGFSYFPEEFQMEGISYYNLCWMDMTAPDFDIVMNIMHLMALHVDNDQNVLVHCHAGLGRTGLIIACFIMYHEGKSAEEAITLTRKKRPRSIQTRSQVRFVYRFGELLTILRAFYFPPSDRLTLSTFIEKQKIYLHGQEYRELRFVPKVVHEMCMTIERYIEDAIEENAAGDDQSFSVLLHESTIFPAPLEEVEDVCEDICELGRLFVESLDTNLVSKWDLDASTSIGDRDLARRLRRRIRFKRFINLAQWSNISFAPVSRFSPPDAFLLLLDWLFSLKLPIIDSEDILILLQSEPYQSVLLLDDCTRHTFVRVMELLFSLFRWSDRERYQDFIMSLVLSAFTHDVQFVSQYTIEAEKMGQFSLDLEIAGHESDVTSSLESRLQHLRDSLNGCQRAVERVLLRVRCREIIDLVSDFPVSMLLSRNLSTVSMKLRILNDGVEFRHDRGIDRYSIAIEDAGSFADSDIDGKTEYILEDEDGDSEDEGRKSEDLLRPGLSIHQSVRPSSASAAHNRPPRPPSGSSMGSRPRVSKHPSRTLSASLQQRLRPIVIPDSVPGLPAISAASYGSSAGGSIRREAFGFHSPALPPISGTTGYSPLVSTSPRLPPLTPHMLGRPHSGKSQSSSPGSPDYHSDFHVRNSLKQSLGVQEFVELFHMIKEDPIAVQSRTCQLQEAEAEQGEVLETPDPYDRQHRT